MYKIHLLFVAYSHTCSCINPETVNLNVSYKFALVYFLRTVKVKSVSGIPMVWLLVKECKQLCSHKSLKLGYPNMTTRRKSQGCTCTIASGCSSIDSKVDFRKLNYRNRN